jgi:hypothetical protein
VDYTVDRALIYAILKGGVSAFQAAKNHGIEASFLTFEDETIFRAMEEVFLPKGKMPSLAELAIHCKVDVPPTEENFDVDLCSKQIIKRALANKLSEGLGPIEQDLTTDPFSSRSKLQVLVQETNWSMGLVARTDSPAAIEEVEKRYLEAKAQKEGLLGYSSPWPLRDKQSLGLQKGEVTVVLAKRKTGKSWFLFKWAEHIWSNKLANGEPELKPGECVMVVSMEMPVWQVMRRFFAIHRRLDYELFRAGKLPTVEEKMFFEWTAEQKKPNQKRPFVIFVGSDKVRTVRDLVGMVAQYQPKVVFIDGFYILGRDGGKGGSKQAPLWERTMNNIAEIKLDVAVGMNVSVVASTQLGGQVKRGDLNAEADAVAYAKAIGDYADAIDGLFGSDDFKEQGRRILRGMEAREFVTIDLDINFNPKTQDYSQIGVNQQKALENQKKQKKADEDDEDEDDMEFPIGD